METLATFNRQRTFLRDHSPVVQTMELKASAELELPAGAVLAGENGVAALAADTVTAAKVIGILSGPVTLKADEYTTCAVVLHGDAVLDELTVASGADKAKIAAVLKTVGIFAY